MLETGREKEAENHINNDVLLSASNLFMELASEARLSIIVSLNNKPAKLSILARETNRTAPEVSRNLDRLIEEGLVVKEVDGLFHITEYGMMVIRQVPYFTFIKKHRDFFESHSLVKSGIPEKYLQRIGQLEKSRVVNSTTAVIQTLKKMQLSACQFIKLMVTQAWPEEGQILVDKATHEVKVYALNGLNTIFPSNIVREIFPSIERLIQEGKLESRIIERARMGIYISDYTQAGLMFPNKNGEVDVNTLFVSNDPIFCEWCSDIFEYFWQHSGPGHNLKKLKSVDI